MIRKAVTRGSGRRRWKSTRNGNSLASYSTSSPVLRGRSGRKPRDLPDYLAQFLDLDFVAQVGYNCFNLMEGKL